MDEVVDEVVVEGADVSEGMVVDAALPEGIGVSVAGAAAVVVDGVVLLDIVSLDGVVVVGGVVTVVVVVELGVALAPELL